MPKSRRPVDPRLQNEKAELSFADQPVISDFIKAITDGGENPAANELFAFGSRGDGKTIGALTGMIAHAMQHHAMGFPLPVPWMGVADTFVSHKLKTVRSLEDPIWKGGWRMSDQDHTATFYCGNPAVPYVRIDLFGIEDQDAKNKMRMASVGLWFEEPAPAGENVSSHGIDEDSWSLGLTSLRIPSHFHPAVATLNYPDEDHWTVERSNPRRGPVFAHPEAFREILKVIEMPWPKEFDEYPHGTPPELCRGTYNTTQWFRVPCGERANEIDRLQWANALAHRKDLFIRLILGDFGVIQLGDQVAKGFVRSAHVTRQARPFERGADVFMGFDFGNTPTCVIGQPHEGTMRIGAALSMTNAGMRQLMEEKVLPWLSKYAPWVRSDPDSYAVVGYDPSQGTMEKPKGGEADVESAALTTIMEMLGGGNYEPGPVQWPPRREAIVNVFQRARGLLIEENPHTLDLIRALDGRWYYAKSHTGDLRSDTPKKPNHPWEDLGDALIYLLCRYGLAGNEHRDQKIQVLTNLDHSSKRASTPDSVQVLSNVR